MKSSPLANPEDVLKYIETHEEKTNAMAKEGEDIISEIKKMNKELSTEIQSQNILIKAIDKNIDKGNDVIKENSSKLDEIVKTTSNTHLVIAMIIQIVIIIILIFV